MVCDRDEQGTVSVRVVACCDRHEKGGETSMMFSTSSDSDGLLPEMKVKNTNKKNKIIIRDIQRIQRILEHRDRDLSKSQSLIIGPKNYF